MEKEKKITNDNGKPNFLLWLIGVFIFNKMPFIFSVYYILRSLGLEDIPLAVSLSLVIGHCATSWFDQLNDEVNDYVIKNDKGPA
jgi:hypothetical protein